MDDTLQLIKNCNNYEHEISPEDCFDETNVYKVEAGDAKVTYWNSSNNKAIDHRFVLREIVECLLNEEMQGSLNEPYQMVEVMWETIGT